MKYIINVDNFEGPLDLLHQLIEKRKLSINKISIANITDGYLQYLKKLERFNAEEVANFIYVASILVLIKSKSLLPILEYTKEENVDIDELEARMKLYGFIKNNVVPHFDKWVKTGAIISRYKRDIVYEFRPDETCSLKSVHTSALSALKELSFVKKEPEKRVRKNISIESIINKILAQISERREISFNAIINQKEKLENIISFLAILELIRKEVLTLEEKGDDILISKV